MAYRGSTPDINAPRTPTATATPAATPAANGGGGGGGGEGGVPAFGGVRDAGAGVASRLLRPGTASRAALARQARDEADATAARGKREGPVVPAQTVKHARAFGPDDAVRSGAGPLARNRMSATKNRVNKEVSALGGGIAARIGGSPGGGAALEQMNRALADTGGKRSGLKPNVRKAVTALDNTIAAHEGANDREHVVYARAEPAGDPAAFKAAMQRVINNGGSVSSDRYMVADHNPAQVPEGKGGVVYEIRTTRGMYTGRTDKTADSGHLLPRNTHYEPVGIKEVQVVGADGKAHTRTVIQMVDSGTAARDRAANAG